MVSLYHPKAVQIKLQNIWLPPFSIYNFSHQDSEILEVCQKKKYIFEKAEME